VLAKAAGTVEVEFGAPPHPSPAERAFVEAPWELLAWPEGSGGSGFLAADAIRRFCPYRRLGAEAAPPAPGDHRLGIAFMAASPRGGVELDFEGEENAIIAATRRIGVDLEVEDSGNLDLLAERLAELEPMQVVHLSCHGTNRPEPRLLLEDEAGDEVKVAAADLAEALQTGLPGVLFLSACLTAAGTVGEADPLVGAMVRAGLPAVLGWDGSVRDGEATRFAAVLYGELQRRAALAAAVATARRQLLAGDADHRPARDWHLARLWLGPAGGGPLVSGRNRKRRAIAEEHGFKAFLDKRQSRSPVASREAFVGRRHELQRCLATLRGQERAGVLVHGMGRLGKSSLAARLASRMAGHETAVLYEGYRPQDLLAALRATSRETAAVIDQRAPGLQPTAESLELLLREVLEGPASGNEAGRPVLLVVDDLEQILDDPLPGGLHRVKPERQALMIAVLRAFDPARTESRLVVTSRYRFTLPDRGADLASRLGDEQLGPMHEAGARKQALRREGGSDLAATAGTAELVNRAVEVARGHPGLQDLLLDLATQSPTTAASVLEQMEAYLDGGELPGEAEVKAYLLNLTLDHLLGLLSDAERELLRATTLFELPVPLEVLRRLESAVGGRLDRLLALGLVDRFEDIVRPETPAGAANALVAPLLEELSEQEAAAMAGLVAEPLLAAWGGEERRGKPVATDLELTRLALLAGHASVAAVCAPWALLTLGNRFAYRQAAEWARAVIALIDREPSLSPLSVLDLAAEAVIRVGDPEPAQGWLMRAATMHDERPNSAEPVVAGGVFIRLGRAHATEGRMGEALTAFQRARDIFHEAGIERDTAIALGEIADILAEQGAVDEALALHRERLQVYERLGDVRERSTALWSMGQIHLGQRDFDRAVPEIVQAYTLARQIGELSGIAVTGHTLGQLMAAMGECERGLAMLRESEAGFRRLGQLGDANEVAETIREIEAEGGQGA
jgi:tetratricopeptide (TPR) repeat protein